MRASSSSTAIGTSPVSTKRTIEANRSLRPRQRRASLLNQTFDQQEVAHRAEEAERHGTENAAVRTDRNRVSVHAGGHGRDRADHPRPARRRHLPGGGAPPHNPPRPPPRGARGPPGRPPAPGG